MSHPLQTLIAELPFVILDGGLATELEKLGCDLDHHLWSAKILRDRPELIARVHRAYLAAGADVIITASYQATVPGFLAEGMREPEALALLRRAVRLALDVREASGAARAHRPLVAASVGPYGAFLADGSEYRGACGLDEHALAAFHRPRIAALLEAGADLLACETIPSPVEARALVRVLGEFPDARAWITFSARDGRAISDGTPFADCVAMLAGAPQILATGINCTAPQYVTPLLRAARAVTSLPLVAYPNAGEQYDPVSGGWCGSPACGPEDFARLATEWLAAGAKLVGGCCRTGPGEIAALCSLRDRLSRRG
jgi:homocysteine S-methyltransferase